MFKALHPHSNVLMTYLDYKEFAINSGFQKANDAPNARCPICKGPMHIRAGQTKDDGHFFHIDDRYCSTKKPAARPYLTLFSTTIDPAIIIKNKKFLLDNIEQVYFRVSEIAPLLDFLEFINMLKEANRLNIYAYSNLLPEHIPYILVTLINFLPSKSFKKKRELKFLFFYEDKIHSFAELWINKGFTSNFYRISYSGSVPNKLTKIDITTDYLDKVGIKLSPNQLAWCKKII